jgi:hypothetical protein
MDNAFAPRHPGELMRISLIVGKKLFLSSFKNVKIGSTPNGKSENAKAVVLQDFHLYLYDALTSKQFNLKDFDQLFKYDDYAIVFVPRRSYSSFVFSELIEKVSVETSAVTVPPRYLPISTVYLLKLINAQHNPDIYPNEYFQSKPLNLENIVNFILLNLLLVRQSVKPDNETNRRMVVHIFLLVISS